MKLTFTVSYILLLHAATFAQGMDPSIRRQFTMESLSRGPVNPTSMTYGIPVPPGETKGDTYWAKAWYMAEVRLKDGKMIEGFQVKYDLLNNELHFKVQNQIKYLKADQVLAFVWRDTVGSDHFFINTNELRLSNLLTEQLVEVLHDGNLKLVKRMYTVVKDPDYNLALNTGSRDTKIFQKSELLLLDKGDAVRIKNSKDLIKQFPDQADALKTYLKENDLGNSEYDLIQCVAFLDTKHQL